MTDDARPRTETARGRALLAVAVLATVTAVVLVVAAFGNGEDDVVLDVESVTASTLPDTVPPIAEASADRDATPNGADPTAGSDADSRRIDEQTGDARPDVATTTTTVPLAALLGPRGSAIPVPPEPVIAPRRLTIDAIRLSGRLTSVGVEDDGELEVPGATEIGWYRYGSAPGRPGATVVAAHVSWNGDLGMFFRLGEVEPGDRIDVELDDGTERVYEVTERTMYDKDELPPERIWTTSGPETLVLITCGGDFNPEISRYRQNIVVYAVPVA